MAVNMASQAEQCYRGLLLRVEQFSPLQPIGSQNKLFVAIDTGGTRSSIRLDLEENGVLLTDKHAEFETDLAISGTLNEGDYPATFEKILENIGTYWNNNKLSKANTMTYLFIASAGYALNTQNSFRSVMTEILPKHLGGSIASAGASNDAVALIYAYKTDVAVIAGTGSNIIVKTKDDLLLQSGGHDWIAYDHGSGFWIGLKAIREVASDFQKGNDSALLSRFKDTYEIHTDAELKSKFRDFAIVRSDMKARISKFAKDVCAAAQIGDDVAQDIVLKEAEALADYAENVINKAHFTDAEKNRLSIVLCGNIINNELYQSRFKSQISTRLYNTDKEQYKITWITQKHGIEAAYLLARKLAYENEYFKQLIKKAGPEFQPTIIDFQ